MSILIKNTTILTQNQQRQQVKGNIYIEDDSITHISRSPLSIEADYVIDGNRKLVCPGFINTHTHIPMTLFRGYGDDMLLKNWLEERIWPVEAKLDKNAIEIGTALGLLEMIASGTTTYLDMYFFEDVIGKITQKTGIRGFLGFALIDAGTPEFPGEKLLSECELFTRKWKKSDLITPVIAPHGTYTCGPETLQQSLEISEKYDVPLHIHCSETRDEVYDVKKQYGLRPIAQLQKYGLLNEKMILAHCGWITKNEIIEMKKTKVKVSHCPVSNMKIGTGGVAPIPEMIDAGITVSLGTDGAASNNSLDMIDTMKFCALIHKHHRWDPSIVPAQTVLDFATIDGAKCLGVEKKIGSIEEGKKADLIIFDLEKPHFTPLHDLVSHVVYSARGTDVCTTIVNGKPLFLNNAWITLDVNKTLENAQNCAMQLIN